MYQYLVEAGLLVLDYVYHRWIDPPAYPTIPPGQQVTIPRTDAGAPYPMIFGKVRVRSPVLAFMGKATATADINGGFDYCMNLGFALGIPFTGSDANNSLWNMWIGDAPTSFTQRVIPGPYPIPGYGTENVADVTLASAIGSAAQSGGPFVEFLDGRSTQVLVDGSGVAQNWAGTISLNAGFAAADIPGYRGVLFATCYSETLASGWFIGTNPNVPSYSFEVSSYPAASLGPNGGKVPDATDPANLQYDANPVDVIYDILTGGYGKLGLDPSLIDIASFVDAATTLYNEGHGYSMSIEGGKSAQDIIKDICAQIDATIYTDPSTNTIKLKLIRPDYNPATIPQITPDNCEALQNFSLGGWSDVPNKVRIVFNARTLGNKPSYNSDSALGMNASSVFDNGAHEIQIEMPGCTNSILARQIAARELAARSRPIAKCSAIVNRSFYNVCPGDAVAVTWPEANISGMIFRVAAVDRGTLRDGKIRLDLVQDYFYQWRNNGPVNPGVGSSFGGGRVVAE